MLSSKIYFDINWTPGTAQALYFLFEQINVFAILCFWFFCCYDFKVNIFRII